MEALIVILQLGFPLSLLALGFVVGKIAESRHYKSIRMRERLYLDTPVVSWKTLHDDRPVREVRMAVGTVVVSVDHYKRLMMAFRRIFGGESYAYASLIDRGRREALLRMKQDCPNADLFLNCRLETSTISNGRQKSTGTVEVMAYATAVMFAS